MIRLKQWIFAVLFLAGLWSIYEVNAQAAGDAVYVGEGETLILDENVDAPSVEVSKGATLTIHGSLRTDKLVVGENAYLEVDKSLTAKDASFAYGAGGRIGGRFTATTLTMRGNEFLLLEDAVNIKTLKTMQTNGGTIHLMAQHGAVSVDKVTMIKPSDTDKVVFSYGLDYGISFRRTITGGTIYIAPYREDARVEDFADGEMLAHVSDKIGSGSVVLYQNDAYIPTRDKIETTKLIAGKVKLYMVTEKEDGTDAPARTFASLLDAIDYITTLVGDAGNRIFLVGSDTVDGDLIIRGGHEIRLYRDKEDAEVVINGKISVRDADSSFTIGGLTIRDGEGAPVSAEVKRGARLILKNTKVGSVNATTSAEVIMEGDVRVMGNFSGNGNLTVSGNGMSAFLGSVNMHDLSVNVTASQNMPEMRILMNKKLTISGIVRMDADRLKKGDGILLSYAYMTDPDQLTYAGEQPQGDGAFVATIDKPFYVAIPENTSLIQAGGNTVVAGMFRLRNTDEYGKTWYLSKYDRYIRTSYASAVLYEMDQQTGKRTSTGTYYGGMKEAMEAINFQNSLATYEISLLKDVDRIDLSGGLPARLRLISSGKENASRTGYETVNIKTNKNVLLLGHLNLAFVNLEAKGKTFYANDFNMTLLLASMSIGNLNHCNILTLAGGAALEISKEGNTINELVVDESARMDCPQYTSFRADDLEKSVLVVEAAPSLKATEDAYKRCVDYLVNGEYEVPWKSALFIGDSVTQGVQSGQNFRITQENTYPYKFYERLGVEVTNAGIGGSTIWRGGGDPMVDRCCSYGDSFDAIFVMGGSNDWFHGYSCPVGDTETDNTFSYDFDRMLDQLCEKYPESDIFVLLPNEPREHAGVTPYEDFTAIRNAERSIAKAHDCFVIDLQSQGIMCATDPETQEKYYSDFAHPNSAGYEMMGTILAAQAAEMAQWK